MIALALLGPLVVLVVAELARTLVARSRGLPIERRALLVRLVGDDRRGRRALAIAAGPLAAYLAIAAGAFVLVKCHGVVESHGSIVARVMPAYDAVGKLQVDDRILEVDGEPHRGTPELVRRVVDKAGAPVTLLIERAGQLHEVTIAPTFIADGRTWRIGVLLAPGLDRSTATAASRAIAYPLASLRRQLRDLVERLAGPDAAEPGGPVRIAAEYRAPLEPRWVRVLRLALTYASLAWLALALFDATRLVQLALRSRAP